MQERGKSRKKMADKHRETVGGYPPKWIAEKQTLKKRLSAGGL
jgi:hypothetical protein